MREWQSTTYWSNLSRDREHVHKWYLCESSTYYLLVKRNEITLLTKVKHFLEILGKTISSKVYRLQLTYYTASAKRIADT